jgi:hypothetical protein
MLESFPIIQNYPLLYSNQKIYIMALRKIKQKSTTKKSTTKKSPTKQQLKVAKAFGIRHNDLKLWQAHHSIREKHKLGIRFSHRLAAKDSKAYSSQGVDGDRPIDRIEWANMLDQTNMTGAEFSHDVRGWKGPGRMHVADERIWMFVQELKCWRLWCITHTGAVTETFHHTPPKAVVKACERYIVSDVEEREPVADLTGLVLERLERVGVEEDAVTGEAHMVPVPFMLACSSDWQFRKHELVTSVIGKVASSLLRRSFTSLEELADPCVVLSPLELFEERMSGQRHIDLRTPPMGFVEKNYD